MSLEEWQRRLRKQFATEQPFRVENIGEHPIFSDFRVTNPTRGSVHRVAIRSAEPGRNYCSCADFRTNHLGTCKHIEFTLATLLARRGAARSAPFSPATSRHTAASASNTVRSVTYCISGSARLSPSPSARPA